MKFLRQLAKTELVSLVALAIAAAALAAFSAVQASLAAKPLLGAAGSAKVVFLYTMVFGCLPVALFGAPLYSTLRYFQKAGWLTAIGIGVSLGLALLFVATDETSYEKMDTQWLGALGFKLDGRAVAKGGV